MLANRFTDEMARPPLEIRPYPLQNELTRELRHAAAGAGRADLLPFYGGQSAPLASLGSAADLVATLAAEAGAALERAASPLDARAPIR